VSDNDEDHNVADDDESASDNEDMQAQEVLPKDVSCSASDSSPGDSSEEDGESNDSDGEEDESSEAGMTDESTSSTTSKDENDSKDEDAVMETWDVQLVSEISDKNDGKGLLATVRVVKVTGSPQVTARITLNECSKYFQAQFVKRMEDIAADRKKMLDFVETNEVEEVEDLVKLIKKQKWSRKIRQCECSHDVSAGWKKWDQSAYFKPGFRFFGSSCMECKKTIVSHGQVKENEYKASFGVFVCIVESVEDCRSILCTHCHQSKFTNEGRPSRKRGTA
jgi:hypothetical protein